MSTLEFEELLSDITVIGIQSNESIEELSTGIGISFSKDEKIQKISIDYSKLPEFQFKKSIIFDSTSRLDASLITPEGIIGFITVSSGAIILNRETKKWEKKIPNQPTRILVIPNKKRDTISGIQKLKIDKNIEYEIHWKNKTINNYEELWKEVFLKEILPEIEFNFIEEHLYQMLDDTTVLIKDGSLIHQNKIGITPQNSSSLLNIFGHIKNTNIPEEVKEEIIKQNFPSKTCVYRRQDQNYIEYFCFVNLTYNQNRMLPKGLFNYSKLSLVQEIPLLENLINQDTEIEISSRLYSIANLLIELAKPFSPSHRYPQNLPCISFLENILRAFSSNREIISMKISSKIISAAKKKTNYL